MTIAIRQDDLADPRVQGLIAFHLQEMRAGSPPGQAFALDLSGLRAADVTVFTAWIDDALVGVAALKAIDDDTGEVKSMRVPPERLGQGIGRALVDHLVAVARARGYRRLSLETGSGPMFDAALALYRRSGFVAGEPFGGYAASAFNQFLHRDL